MPWLCNLTCIRILAFDVVEYPQFLQCTDFAEWTFDTWLIKSLLLLNELRQVMQRYGCLSGWNCLRWNARAPFDFTPTLHTIQICSEALPIDLMWDLLLSSTSISFSTSVSELEEFLVAILSCAVTNSLPPCSRCVRLSGTRP